MKPLNGISYMAKIIQTSISKINNYLLFLPISSKKHHIYFSLALEQNILFFMFGNTINIHNHIC